MCVFLFVPVHQWEQCWWLLGALVVSAEHSWSSRGAQQCGIPRQLRRAIYSAHTQTHTVCIGAGVVHTNDNTNNNNRNTKIQKCQVHIVCRWSDTQLQLVQTHFDRQTCVSVMSELWVTHNKMLVCRPHTQTHLNSTSTQLATKKPSYTSLISGCLS